MEMCEEKTRREEASLHVLVRAFAVAAVLSILLLSHGGNARHVDHGEMSSDDTPVILGSDVDGGKSSEVMDEQWPGIVRTKGTQCVVGDRPFYVNGFNTYWLMIFAAKVSEVLQQAAAVGLTVCRTWWFNDGGWSALQKSPSIYGEDVFKALDFVVSEARKYRIRLILSLSNNWDGYGGKAQCVKWAKGPGVNLTSDDDFFSDQTVKDYNKNHIKRMLTWVNTYTNVTYKDDPTIFAWELMNRCREEQGREWIVTGIWEKVHMCVIAEALPRRGLPALPYNQVRKRLRELQKIWERANELKKLPKANVKKDEWGSIFITILDSQYGQHIRKYPEDAGLINKEICNFRKMDLIWGDPFAAQRHLLKTTDEEEEMRVCGLRPLKRRGTSKKYVGSSKDKGTTNSSTKGPNECSSDEDFSKLTCFKAPDPGLFASDSKDDFM